MLTSDFPSSLRRTILTRVLWLVTAVVFLVGSGFVLFVLRPLLDDLAERQFNAAVMRVEVGLGNLFSPADRLLQMSRGWVSPDALDLERPDDFNRLFMPILKTLPQITSVVAGTPAGQGWLLLQQPNGVWRNRMTDIARWKERHLIIDTSPDGQVESHWQILDYDARQRPWFIAAMDGSHENELHWTSPYTFFTTGDPGVTASMRMRLMDGQDVVIGLDFMLRDLSLATMNAKVGERGMALVMTEDARVLALPASPGVGNDLWLKQILQPVPALGLMPVTDALLNWNRSGQPSTGVMRYRSGGVSWLAGFRPYALGAQRLWIVTLAPAKDFSAAWMNLLAVMAAVLLLGLLVSVVLARTLARRIAEPLEDLAEVSEKIGQLDFQTSMPAASGIMEIDQLGLMQDGMRLLLQQNQMALASQADDLRLQIEALSAAEDKIEYLAFYDPLTHLPNRRLLLDRLQQALASSERNQRQGALLFIDLDNFKTLNDTLGRDVGDQLLQQAAQRIDGCVSEADTVARQGGDEFLVILEDLGESPEEVAAKAKIAGENILAALSEPYLLAGISYQCTSSIGITLFNSQNEAQEELMKRVEIAMYQAKSFGRNTLRFFEPDMQAVIETRSVIETALRSALPRNELRLHYQMQVDATGRIFGAEVLLRWQHPERGLIPPLQFIPLAEETGLIIPIGLWVLQTACKQLKAWQPLAGGQQLRLAVNVSARQFRQPDFTRQVTEVLRDTGVNPEQIELELTESIVLDNISDTIKTMHELRQIGVRFSMDDFGTGYSSLSYVQKLPFDQIKIDQSFARAISTNPHDAVIVQTIIAMAQNLNLEVIAEGVETEQQKDFLSERGCLHFQGYLFGKPVPPEEFERFLAG